MKKQRKSNRVELNSHDRKILEKYTGFYTNFIESNTVRSDMNVNQDVKAKK